MTPVSEPNADPEPEPLVSPLTAQRVLEAITDPHSWIYRRVEHFEIIDTSRICRKVSVDCAPTLPTIVDTRGNRLRPVPLGFLPKGAIRNFDLRRSDRSAANLLPSVDTGTMVTAAVLALADDTIRNFVDVNPQAAPPTESDRRRSAASFIWRTVYDRPVPVAHDTSSPPAVTRFEEALLEDGNVGWFLNFLSNHFLLVAALPPGTPLSQRELVKFSLETKHGRDGGATETKLPQLRWFERLAVAVGWRAKYIEIPVESAFFAGSFHAEISAPDGVDLMSLRLVGIGRDTTESRVLAEASGPDARLHLHATPPNRGIRTSLLVELRASRGGWLRPAFLTALLTTLVLLAGWKGFESAEHPSTLRDASTVVLALTSVFPAVLVRRGEHSLAARLLVGARAFLLISLACLLAMAGSLAFGIQYLDDSYAAWWWRFGLVSAVPTIGLGLSLALPRAHQNSK